MAINERKRETVFPGSNAFADLFGPAATRVSRTASGDRNKPQPLPRISLSVNPTGSQRDQLNPIRTGNPWAYYRTAFGLQLGSYVAIVVKTPATGLLYSMHSFSGPEKSRKLWMLRQLAHRNLLCPEEIFNFEDSVYVISEYAAISLDDVMLVRPTETQLAAIVHQILNAISYLISRNFTHGSITSSVVLLTTDGVVKIGKFRVPQQRGSLTISKANPENCSDTDLDHELVDEKALGVVMLKLMGEGGASVHTSAEAILRLKKSMHWSAQAIEFVTLTMTESATNLAKHPFLQDPPQVEELVALAEISKISACRFYDAEKSYMPGI